MSRKLSHTMRDNLKREVHSRLKKLLKVFKRAFSVLSHIQFFLAGNIIRVKYLRQNG